MYIRQKYFTKRNMLFTQASLNQASSTLKTLSSEKNLQQNHRQIKIRKNSPRLRTTNASSIKSKKARLRRSLCLELTEKFCS